jgi:hypothetical protein
MAHSVCPFCLVGTPGRSHTLSELPHPPRLPAKLAEFSDVSLAHLCDNCQCQKLFFSCDRACSSKKRQKHRSCCFKEPKSLLVHLKKWHGEDKRKEVPLDGGILPFKDALSAPFQPVDFDEPDDDPMPVSLEEESAPLPCQLSGRNMD